MASDDEFGLVGWNVVGAILFLVRGHDFRSCQLYLFFFSLLLFGINTFWGGKTKEKQKKNSIHHALGR